MKIIAAALVTFALMTGCTANERAKSWGGDMTIRLPCDQKLFDVTWKETDLWYVTRRMHPDETAETYIFREDSSWSMMEGTVTFVECEKGD